MIMNIKLTKLEIFMQDGMTRSEIIPDLNALYTVINNKCNTKSSDYVCYVTPKRELLVLFTYDNLKCSSEELIQLIYDETVIRSYDIETIIIMSADDFDINYITPQEFSSKDEEVQSIVNDRVDLDDYIFEGNLTLENLELIKSLPTKYRPIIKDITQIKGLSFSTLQIIMGYFLADNNLLKYKNSPIKLDDRRIVLNTLEVFLSDISKTGNYVLFKEEILQIKEYFYNDIELEDKDITQERNEKGKLATIKYLFGADLSPFSQRDIISTGRQISIKFYLLLSVTYFEYTRMRKMERTAKMRKNKKRNIAYIDKILSGERTPASYPLIDAYLKGIDYRYSPDGLTTEDVDELEELKIILDKRPEYFSRHIADVMNEILGKKSSVLINRYLGFAGFKGIGHSCKV